MNDRFIEYQAAGSNTGEDQHERRARVRLALCGSGSISTPLERVVSAPLVVIIAGRDLAQHKANRPQTWLCASQ